MMLNKKYFNKGKVREILFIDLIELSAYIVMPDVVNWIKYNTKNLKNYYRYDKLIIKKAIKQL